VNAKYDTYIRNRVVAQTLAFSYLLVAWHHRPGRAWGIVMGAIMALVVLASIGGTLALQPPAR